MPKPEYDTSKPNLVITRQILLDWLRNNPSANNLPYQGKIYLQYVELTPSSDPEKLASQIMEVFWQLVIEGIVVPGKGAQPSEVNLPWFRLTPYGRKVLELGPGHPHDPAGYLASVHRRVPSPDGTVIAYLKEAVATFLRASNIAAMVMLGIAAERVFLLLCDSLNAALADPTEQKKFQALLTRLPIKPKLDWVHTKLQSVQEKRPVGFPGNATLMVTAIYDILRSQRNDLGHPRDLPPTADREEACVTLQIFPRFYETAEILRSWLSTNKI